MTQNHSLYLIVGLGNTGDSYSFHRHNIGFLSLDHFISQETKVFSPLSSSWTKEHQAEIFKMSFAGGKLLLAKPQTFMNLSGEAVQSLMTFYKIPLSHLLVIHDDLDTPFLSLKLLSNRGHGGQNGVRSIHSKIGSDYSRLKCGIGRPSHPGWSISDWVLSNWSQEEASHLSLWLQRISAGIESWVTLGAEKATNKINSSPKKS
jgi:peptidyl-tRNA hydrolase, PTH1 family